MSTTILDNLKNTAIELEKNITNSSIFQAQKEFLETDLGKSINNAIDTGLRTLLPNYIDDEIIEIKNAILTEGFLEGIKTAINNVIDFGKNLKSVFTGDFKNISQIQEIIKNGGLLDTISELLDEAINFAKDKKWIDSATAKIIKKGKNNIMNAIEENIDDNFTNQLKSVEKIQKYIEKWKTYFENEDFTNMNKQYNLIKKEMEKVVPLKTLFEDINKLENLHELIKNNGKNFKLSEEELALAEILI